MADFSIESEIYQSNPNAIVCGIDEAGRGPWAGPVVAAAVVLDPQNIPNQINDSKKLSERQRIRLYDEIRQTALGYNIEFIGSEIIDEINILQATFKAMYGACNGLKTRPTNLLIDGNRDPKIGIETQTIIKGDAISLSIAAASILAKVARDNFMCEIEKQFPQYGFAKHKGYGVKAHMDALSKHGPCPIHRFSFKPIKAIINNEMAENR